MDKSGDISNAELTTLSGSATTTAPTSAPPVGFKSLRHGTKKKHDKASGHHQHQHSMKHATYHHASASMQRMAKAFAKVGVALVPGDGIPANLDLTTAKLLGSGSFGTTVSCVKCKMPFRDHRDKTYASM